MLGYEGSVISKLLSMRMSLRTISSDVPMASAIRSAAMKFFSSGEVVVSGRR
ncbi:MAG: hypothetical protein IJY64_06435 [Bacteroidaceae bacterium]|nr:hypothetical protein [Bacteroidaceae bacterium]